MVSSGKSACSLAISSTIERRICASSADSGSSSNNTRGRTASARAIATRCCWPPDSSRGKRRANFDMPTMRSESSTRSTDQVLRRAARIEAEGDVLGNAHVGKQRVVLDDHREAALIGRQVRHVGPADEDAPGGGTHEPGDRTQRGRLARARRADHGENFARRHRHRQRLQNHGAAIGDADFVEDHVRARGRFRGGGAFGVD